MVRLKALLAEYYKLQAVPALRARNVRIGTSLHTCPL